MYDLSTIQCNVILRIKNYIFLWLQLFYYVTQHTHTHAFMSYMYYIIIYNIY